MLSSQLHNIEREDDKGKDTEGLVVACRSKENHERNLFG
jgi:hypothetical protein